MECATLAGLSGASGTSQTIRKLIRLGVAVHVGSLPPQRGKRDGTKLYVPPGWTGEAA